MKKEAFLTLITEKMKLIRIESDYTQEQMAELLGISKKTLVQIEKGRTEAGWGVAVTVSALFQESEVLQHTFGDNPLELVKMIANESTHHRKEKTWGGKVWWKEIEQKGLYRLQQNIVSQHFRVLDDEDYRLMSTFNEEEARVFLNALKEKQLVSLTIEEKLNTPVSELIDELNQDSKIKNAELLERAHTLLEKKEKPQ